MSYILFLQLQIQLLQLKVQQLQAQLVNQLVIEAQIPQYIQEVRTLNAEVLGSSTIRFNGYVSDLPAKVTVRIMRALRKTNFEESMTILATTTKDISMTFNDLFPGNVYIYQFIASPQPGGPTVIGAEKRIVLPCTPQQLGVKAIDCNLSTDY